MEPHELHREPHETTIKIRTVTDMSRTTQKTVFNQGKIGSLLSLIQDQKDQIFTQCSTFGAARNSCQNCTKWFGAARPHGGNFENLQMFKNPVLLSCTEIPANPGCSVILGILTT